MRRSPAINNLPTQQDGHSRNTQSPLEWKTIPDPRGNMPQKAPESLTDAPMASTALFGEAIQRKRPEIGSQKIFQAKANGAAESINRVEFDPKGRLHFPGHGAEEPTGRRPEVKNNHWPGGKNPISLRSTPPASSPGAKARPEPPGAELSQKQPRRG